MSTYLMACTPFLHGRLTTALPCVCLALPLILAGCGGGTDDSPKTPRVNATGKVEFDGKPIPAGTVTFTHLDTGNTAVCPISNGTYASEKGQGPNPGLNAVAVNGKETAAGPPMWERPWTRQQVQIGDADFTEDYSIKATEVKPYKPSTTTPKGLDAGDTYDVGS